MHDADSLSLFTAGIGRALVERKWMRKRRSIVGLGRDSNEIWLDYIPLSMVSTLVPRGWIELMPSSIDCLPLIAIEIGANRSCEQPLVSICGLHYRSMDACIRIIFV
jgi:hypothetical protein